VVPNRRRRAPLWLRLAVAFVLVAVAGVALLAGLTLASTNSQVASFSREQERETTSAVVAAVAAAYRQAGGWPGADLDAALVVAGEGGAAVAVFDQAHKHIAGGLNVQSGPQGGAGSTTDGSGPTRTVPVVVAGRTVGNVVFGFRGSGLSPALAALRDRLIQTVGIGAGVAGLLALAVALVVAQRITRPVAALTRVARARESGDRAARVGPLKAPGEVEELAVAFDRMADAVSREDELRRALVADVAHELRTPISILQASSEAVLDGVVEPSPGVISSIHEEVLRLRTRVEDLEVLASAEAAGLRMSAERVDLAQVAGEAAATLAPRFEAAQVELERVLEPVTVSGDRARLHQIVTNLLTNAIKFIPAGGQARLEVAAIGGIGRLKLTDTGPGMSAEELGHIFERFWRGKMAADTPGSGIGLAVVAELVRAHRGTIEAESEPGRGTTFVISLPRV
jgi:two-component system, OmpR family, sensor histidine kinase BaeS